MKLVIDGVEVRFLPGPHDTIEVVAADVLGTLELTPDGERFVARRPNGDALMKPSRWGGYVTAHFGTRELAARALMATGDAHDDVGA